MKQVLSRQFLEKAHAAITSAVEIYNKPAFGYREETFAILAVNAWELLLKARILKGARNDPKALDVRVPKRDSAGNLLKTDYTVKLNRAGNALTMSLGECIVK